MQYSGEKEGDLAFSVEDVEYLRHGDQQLFARLYRPDGDGPFPTLIEIHGGVWHENDRTRGVIHHEFFARNGIAVAALDFRQGKNAYPTSVMDINYGIRWVKANASRLNSRPDLVGITGSSSGGHLAILAAMRPADIRYSSIPPQQATPPTDATVRCAILFWPVINPYGRHQNAKRLSAGDDAPKWAARTLSLSMAYWGTEEAMIEGSPLLAIERGEELQLPPVLWIQGENDNIHDYRDLSSGFSGTEAQRFVKHYRRAGGKAFLEYFNAPLHFTTDHPNTPESVAAKSSAVAFAIEHIRNS